jgi:hypothetical protein
LLQQAWHRNPDERPDFHDVIDRLEMVRVSPGIRNLGTPSTSTSSLSSCTSFPSDMINGSSSVSDMINCFSQLHAFGLSGSSSADAPPVTGNVTALRTRWEQEAFRLSSAAGVSSSARERPPFEELKRQMDKNGYVSDAISVYHSIFDSHQQSTTSGAQQGSGDEQTAESNVSPRRSPSSDLTKVLLKGDDVKGENKEA